MTPAPPGPFQVVQAFHDRLQAGDADGAMALWAAIPEAAGSPWLVEQAEDLAAFAGMLGTGQWDFVPVEERIDGPAAVVIINETVKRGRPSVDYDPIWLRLEDGQWRISPEMTDYRPLCGDPAVVGRFAALEQWFDARKQELPR